MILDGNLVLHGAIAANGTLSGTAANGAGNVLSFNTVDTGSLALGGNQPAEYGQGEGLFVSIHVLSAPTAGTSVRFQLIQADDAALLTGVQVLGQTEDIPIASLPVGAVVPMNVDRAAPFPPRRFIGMRFVNTGAIATASYFAAIVKSLQDVRTLHLRSGFAVA